MKQANSGTKWKLMIARQTEEDQTLRGYIRRNDKEDTGTMKCQKTELKPIKSKGTLGENVD